MTAEGTNGGVGAGPLNGVRVLELGSFIAGPFAGQLLGDYGADVLKVEVPGQGDHMRRWGITHDGESLWWGAIARNKRSVSIDLRPEEGRALVRRLAASVDILVENFRPGRLEELGLGYDVLAKDNPRIIVVHVSGFGRTGPRANEAGFGSIGEAVGGIRHTTGYPDRPSTRSGVSLGDSLAALFAVIGSLAALAEQRRTGRGQEVDVAIYEAVAALMESSLADFEIGGVLRGRTGSVLPNVAPSNAYPTSDGGNVLIAANADNVFERLCKAMGMAELAYDARFATHEARGANMAELDELISNWTRNLDTQTVIDTLAEHGVPAGRIYTAADMLNDPHYLAREMILRFPSNGSEAPMLGVVPKFSRTPGGVVHPGPRLGEHTRDVLRELAGVEDEEWEQLVAAGVVAASATGALR